MNLKDSTYRTAVFLTDQHIPFEDSVITKIARKYVKDVQPDEIIFGGDLIDNPAMSSFDPDPDNMRDTQSELDKGAKYLQSFRDVSPDSEVVVLYGNHDWGRLERLKHINGYALKNMRVMQFRSLVREAGMYHEFDFSDIKFRHDYTLEASPRADTNCRGVKFLHGDKRMDTQLYGGKTGPRRTSETYKFNGHLVMGHRHRMLVARDQWRDRAVHQVAAMANPEELSQTYTTHSEYERGFLVLHYNLRTAKPEFHFQNLRLENDKHLVIDGKVYEA